MSIPEHLTARARYAVIRDRDVLHLIGCETLAHCDNVSVLTVIEARGFLTYPRKRPCKVCRPSVPGVHLTLIVCNP